MKRKIFYFLKTKEEYDYMLSNNLIPKRGIVFIESTHEIYRNKVLYSGYGPLKTYFESLKTELLSSIQDNKSEFNSVLSLLDLQLQEEFEDYNNRFLTNINTISELIRAALSALSTSDNVINKTIIPTLENFDNNLKKLDNRNLQLERSINSVSETSSLFKTNLSNLVNDVKNLGTKHNKDINNLLNYIKNDILSLITKQNTSNYNSLKDYINNQILQTKLTDSLLKAKVLEFSNINEVQKSLKSQISNLETLLMNQISNKDSDIRNLITTTDAKLRTYVDNKVSSIIANYDELLNNTGGNTGGNSGGSNPGGSSSGGINLSAYATKDYVNNLISSIKVGNLDLSNYATKTYVNDKTKIDSVVKLGDKYLAIERGLLYVDIDMLKSALGSSSGGSSGGTNPSGGETNPSGGGTSDGTDWSDEIDKIKKDIDIIKNYTRQDIEDEVKDIMDNYVDVLTKIKEGKLAWNEIFNDDGWRDSISAYLREVGVIKKDLEGNIITFDWSGLLLKVNEISSTVDKLNVFIDESGNPISYESFRSQIINSIENDTAISKMKATYSTFFDGEDGLKNLNFVFSEIGTLANKNESLTQIINLYGDNLATIKTQSDANKALIEALSLYTGYESGASFKSTIGGAVAEIFAVNSTNDIMAKIQASIKDDSSIINLISNKVISNGDFYAPKVISSNDDMITYIEAGLVKIQSRSNSSCGIFALNSNNEIVLLMYDKDGKCILNLGGTPNALVNGKWRTIRLKRVGTYNTIFHNPSILSMTAKDSDCSNYYELTLGKVTNENNTILYYTPNGYETNDEITISRDLHVFTSTSSTSSGINSLSFIPDGKYVRPNNGIFMEEIMETPESTPQPVVIVYIYKDGILEKTETVKLSNN